VIDSVVMFDRETGRSRGFGFITFAFNHEALHVLKGSKATGSQRADKERMDICMIKGKLCEIKAAEPKKKDDDVSNRQKHRTNQLDHSFCKKNNISRSRNARSFRENKMNNSSARTTWNEILCSKNHVDENMDSGTLNTRRNLDVPPHKNYVNTFANFAGNYIGDHSSLTSDQSVISFDPCANLGYRSCGTDQQMFFPTNQIYMNYYGQNLQGSSQLPGINFNGFLFDRGEHTNGYSQCLVNDMPSPYFVSPEMDAMNFDHPSVNNLCTYHDASFHQFHHYPAFGGNVQQLPQLELKNEETKSQTEESYRELNSRERPDLEETKEET